MLANTIDLPKPITFTEAAQACLDELDVNHEDDLRGLRSGRYTRDTLLGECLSGADSDREQGWREYVDTLCEALPAVLRTFPDGGWGSRELSRHPSQTEALEAGRAYLSTHFGAWIQVTCAGAPTIDVLTTGARWRVVCSKDPA